MEDSAISINNITKRFGDQTVLDGVSYKFEQGKFMVLSATTAAAKLL